MQTDSAPIATDALIIGAGPAGLFSVFELGLLGVHSHVVDSLPFAGGQCAELYADKPIYDIPAVKACTGRELTERLLQQIAPFGATFHLGEEVAEVARQADGRIAVSTARPNHAGTQFIARSVFIAGGAGSFQPKRLAIDSLVPLEGRQLHYRSGDLARLAGARVLVIGAGDAALDAAIALASPGAAAAVTLLHRRDQFDAEPARLAAVQALRDGGVLRFIAGQASGATVIDGRLRAVDVALSSGGAEQVATDHVLVLLGLSPKLGPIARWGLALERKQVVVDPATFETSEPGVYAVGDCNSYPGKKKLILSGFHEATLAAFAATDRLFPERRGPLQYTTSSTQLQRALGVLPNAP